MACPAGALPGIDVSHYQSVVDWPSVAGAGKVFAYAKASEGVNTIDPYFNDNWNGIKQAGLLRGAYHFFHANLDPTAQANNFLAALTAANGTPVLAPGDLPPFLDLEVSGSVVPSGVIANARIWLDLVATATGRTPHLYTFFSFWQNTLGNPADLAEYPLWIARYTDAPSPGAVGGWPTWAFWQYSASEIVDGVGGQVDVDAFQGTAANLNALAGL